MRSVSVDVNSELTVAFRKVRGQWRWVWSAEREIQLGGWERVMREIADEINRVKTKSDERIGNLILALTGIAAQEGTPQKKGSC